MAFEKVKKLGPFTCSSMCDPVANIEDKENFISNYTKSGFDKSLLCCAETEEPTEFVCEPIKAQEISSLPSVNDGSKLFYACFKFGVKEIRNPEMLTRSDLTRIRRDVTAISDKWLDESPIPIGVIYEIGAYIYTMSTLTDDEIKNL